MRVVGIQRRAILVINADVFENAISVRVASILTRMFCHRSKCYLVTTSLVTFSSLLII